MKVSPELEKITRNNKDYFATEYDYWINVEILYNHFEIDKNTKNIEIRAYKAKGKDRLGIAGMGWGCKDDQFNHLNHISVSLCDIPSHKIEDSYYNTCPACYQWFKDMNREGYFYFEVWEII